MSMVRPLLASFCVMSLLALAARGEDPQKTEFFEKQVRPLLVKHCYECHSSKSKELKGNLSLESKVGWQRGGDSGPSIVPGKPQESIFLEAVRYESLEMPPAGKLAESEIAVFEKWIEMGAPDPRVKSKVTINKGEIDLEKGREFWAFQPPRKTPVPEIQRRDWPLTEIDHFILARLEANQLAPAKDADRYTWLRRVTFDLTGLPPTPEEIAEFVADRSETAYAKVVDRLLASPHFGEHWGRHWMDVARYADSNGSDFNATFFSAWRYRNYVIDAFNKDKPYNEFVREQIAGDLLPHENDDQRAEQLIATGFLMVGPKMLSERDKEKLRMDVIDEQIDTVGKAFMGMTLGCARCHHHKFDPIPTEDYYALAGIFRNTITLEGESQQYVSAWKETQLPVSDEHGAALAGYKQAKGKLNKQISEAKKELKSAEQKLARLKPLRLGIVVDDINAKLEGNWKKSTFSPRYVGKGYIHDDKKDKGKKSVTFVPELPQDGEYEVRISFASAQGRDKAVPVTIRHADGEETLKVDQTERPDIGDLFKPLGRFTFKAGKAGEVKISTDGTTEYVIADAAQFIPVEELEKESGAAAMDQQMSKQREKITQTSEQVKKLEAELKRLEKDAPPPAPTTWAARESDEIADCHVCVRGEPHRRSKLVKRGFLRVMTEEKIDNNEQSGRRELADWIASREHPLTARVMVNRIWTYLLGEGIVRSPDNFGQLGDRPSHPALLDFLALEFMENGWSVKQIIRRIALSRVYRIEAEHDSASFEVDPQNRLLWRAHRKRLAAESIRDAMLLVSGQLQRGMAESPVKGFGRLAIDNNPDKAKELEKKKSQRRSVYLPIVRNSLPEFLTVFDFADPDLVTGKRAITNVPAQALLLLNSPFVSQCAQQTATGVAAEETAPLEERIERLYVRVLGRYPTETEITRCSHYLTAQINKLEKQKDREQQAWSRLVQALFASTEFRMLD